MSVTRRQRSKKEPIPKLEARGPSSGMMSTKATKGEKSAVTPAQSPTQLTRRIIQTMIGFSAWITEMHFPGLITPLNMWWIWGATALGKQELTKCRMPGRQQQRARTTQLLSSSPGSSIESFRDSAMSRCWRTALPILPEIIRYGAKVSFSPALSFATCKDMTVASPSHTMSNLTRTSPTSEPEPERNQAPLLTHFTPPTAAVTEESRWS
mmetsp:Transcript_35244/g.76994  ORF Transcript_35244/g.76994 Transcript_35244/m.76994 type:complete len:210 (-) Transcript_35244:867-1496(-)